MPITWTGRPSAEASRRLSPVMSAHEKSRAMLRTAERPVRSSVFSISRTIESSRFAITARRTRSNGRSRGLALLADERRRPRAVPDLEQVVAERRDRGRRAGVDDDRRRRLADDRRGPRCARRWAALRRRSAARERAPARGSRPSASSTGSGSPSAGRSRERTAGLASTAVARAFQSRHSRYWPGSRTAKTRSCVAWNASSSAATSSSSSSRARDRDVELPDLRPVAGLDDELLARLDAAPTSASSSRNASAARLDLGERLVDRVAVERARLGVAAARELGDDVRVQRAAGRERARGGRQQHARAAELARDRDDRSARRRRRPRRSRPRAGRCPARS